MAHGDDETDDPDPPGRPETDLFLPAFTVGDIAESEFIEYLQALFEQSDIAWRRRVLWSGIGVVILVGLYTYAYQWMLFTFEGVEVSITDAFQVVVEAFTTAGFGGDTGHWNTHPMNLFVVLMNLTGVLLVFIALPLFVFPLLRASLEDSPPETTGLEDHVIICSDGDPHELLRDELEAHSIPFLQIDRDPATVLELVDDDTDAIVGDPATVGTLANANIDRARALVADISDEDNLAIILAARERSETIPIVSIAEDDTVATYHHDAGADRVIRPSDVLARSLARKASPRIYQNIAAHVGPDEPVPMTELLVPEDSVYVGQTLGELELRARLDAPVIGIWARGEFIVPPDPTLRLAPYTILLVAGQHDGLPGVERRPVTRHSLESGHIILAGFDVIGRAVAEILEESDYRPTVIDLEEREGVDVRGDVTDRDVLADAGVADARSIVLSLGADTPSMFAGVALGRMAPDVEIIARAHDPDTIGQMYRAGANYVLTLEAVTSRMLTTVLIEEDTAAESETDFDIRRIPTPKLDGLTLRGVNVRKRTGSLVIAVERDDEVITRLPPGFTLEAADTVVAVGTAESLESLLELAN